MCDCRKRIDEALKPKNARIAFGFMFGTKMGLSPPMIEVEKIDKGKRGTSPTLLATFCPFCGERYEEDPGRPVPPHGSGP